MAITFDASSAGAPSGGYTAVANGLTVDANNTTVTSSGTPWVAGDVGKQILIAGGGAGAGDYWGNIASFTANNSIEVTPATDMDPSNTGGEWWHGAFKDTTTTTSLTGYHTCTGTNRYLVVKVWGGDGNLAAKYNDVNMTLLHRYAQGGATVVSLFGLVAPATGNNAIVVWDTTATPQYFAFTSASYTGVDQSTPTGTAAHDGSSGGGTTQSLTVSSATGEVVVDAIAYYYDVSVPSATGSGQVMRAWMSPGPDYSISGGNGQIAGSSTPGAASTVVSYDTGAQTEYWAIAGIPLKPAADESTGTISAVFNVTP